ncbi:MAG: ribonucleotide reductase subunit alpha [Xanthomonadales bacterium]|nr:ribonucleotide reductase subunit alpha [Xanthomonadales bacterium]
MALQDFSDLLKVAGEQAEPQRLLLVFAAAELPRDATEEEKRRFEHGKGGALSPVLCVDKLPQDIADFSSLEAESRSTGIDWDVLFVAALSGRGGHSPTDDEAVQPLTMMVESIKSGRIGNFLAIDRNGELLQLERA